jgi:hypothetical protein
MTCPSKSVVLAWALLRECASDQRPQACTNCGPEHRTFHNVERAVGFRSTVVITEAGCEGRAEGANRNCSRKCALPPMIRRVSQCPHQKYLWTVVLYGGWYLKSAPEGPDVTTDLQESRWLVAGKAVTPLSAGGSGKCQEKGK